MQRIFSSWRRTFGPETPPSESPDHVATDDAGVVGSATGFKNAEVQSDGAKSAIDPPDPKDAAGDPQTTPLKTGQMVADGISLIEPRHLAKGSLTIADGTLICAYVNLDPPTPSRDIQRESLGA